MSRRNRSARAVVVTAFTCAMAWGCNSLLGNDEGQLEDGTATLPSEPDEDSGASLGSSRDASPETRNDGAAEPARDGSISPSDAADASASDGGAAADAGEEDAGDGVDAGDAGADAAVPANPCDRCVIGLCVNGKCVLF